MTNRTHSLHVRRRRSRKAPHVGHRRNNENPHRWTTDSPQCAKVNHLYRTGLTEHGERSLDEAIYFLSAMESLATGDHEDPDPKMSVDSFAAIIHIVLKLLREVSSGIEPMPLCVQAAWQRELEDWKATVKRPL